MLVGEFSRTPLPGPRPMVVQQLRVIVSGVEDYQQKQEANRNDGMVFMCEQTSTVPARSALGWMTRSGARAGCGLVVGLRSDNNDSASHPQ